ncbi:MAG: restriction endonuclease subunit S [Staphylococcus sp.]|nr:restriction endonuclease subunit S [Staphylococcus sp.]
MFVEKTLDELFLIEPGTGVSNLQYMEGNIPYISESAVCNGVRFFINPSHIVKNLIIRKNVISISSKTGVAFFHPYSCVIGQQTAALTLKGKFSDEEIENICLYLLPLIEAQTKIKASFGYQLSTEKLPFVKVIVPYKNDEIDYNYIKKEIYRIKKNINDISISPDSISTNFIKTNWKALTLSEIFSDDELYSATTYDENKLNDNMFNNGYIPYVTRTSENNGIKTFLSSDRNYVLMEGNCITIGLDTQTVFYQENDFYSGQNIIILKPKIINKFIGIFMSSLLEKELKKFSWGSNGATLHRMKRLKLLLPIDDSGNLNYSYMESYIKNMPFSKNL